MSEESDLREKVRQALREAYYPVKWDMTVADRLTEAAMSVVDAELSIRSECLSDELDDAMEEITLLKNEKREAEAAIARVRVLHRQEYGECVECMGERSAPWPCSTIVALGEAP